MTTRTPIKTRLFASVNDCDLHEATDGALYATAQGDIRIVGRAWGPAADGTGEWFAYRAGGVPTRVAGRQAAIDYITSVEVAR